MSAVADCARCGVKAWLSKDRLCQGCERIVPLEAESGCDELVWWLGLREANWLAFEAYYADWQKSHA